MMHITMKTNIPHVAGRIAKFPNKMEKMSDDIGDAWAKMAQKSAKLRAPRHNPTLAPSIKAEKLTKKTWIIGPTGKALRYGRYIERGFKPHWIPIEYIEQHEENPGQKGKRVDNPTGFIYLKGEANPYLVPALNATRTKLKTIFNSALKKNFGGK